MKIKIINIFDLTPIELFQKVTRLWCRYKTKCWYSWQFSGIGEKSNLIKPALILNPKKILIGDNVVLERNATLFSVNIYGNIKYGGEIIISDNVYANEGLNITAANKITIGKYVVIGPNVSLFDFDHGYVDIKCKILESPLLVKGEITIGEDCWIGANTFISGNVTLGMHSVVAANSVVTKSFPNYSVIAGVPARLIKYYDSENKLWVKV